MEKFPTISTYCLLVEKCLQEADQEGDGCEFDDVWKNAKQNDQNDLQVVVEDLVSIVTSGATDAQGQSDAHIQNLIDFSDELVVLDATTDNDDDSNHYGDELRQQQQQQINSMVDNSPPQPLQTRLDFFA
uniref:Uncharacterized protein n=1 Tax=Caenorhabditis japonica TaxID=281687 RepID=A0A8R1IPQ7_CAEJA